MQLNLSKINDKYLQNYENEIQRRFSSLESLVKSIDDKYKSLSEFSKAHLTFGIHQIGANVVVTEWIPNADKAYLIGDFNEWQQDDKYELKSIGDELFQLVLGDFDLSQLNKTRIKLKIVTRFNKILYRISPWSRFLVFNDDLNILEPIVCHSPQNNEYRFRNARPVKPSSVKIYEAHIGIASDKPRIATYLEFSKDVLPRIAQLGYNTVQLMGIMEHAYYASFGYQVTSFFAPSSRFGSADDLKVLIDTAHGLGLRVLLDLIHSHASSNVDDGLNEFDGTDGAFFISGFRGSHPVWGTRLFNYSKLPVIRFLVSNLRWWIEEFNFDGFRFDGVTSMLYYDHGLKTNFSGEYHKYFDLNVDRDSIRYLMLANYFLEQHFPFVTTICEEVSGMPNLCKPVCEGGFGFEYRLGMGIPDMWVKIVKCNGTENWDMGMIVSALSNRRDGEKTVAYAESHDQCLVGDKTLAFWLMDQSMYTNMSVFSTPSIVIDRGLSLHKMIRMITHGLGGEAYLNFMGNEFGHPEWLDFPRKENQSSFQYARRQWNLVDDVDLKYKFLNNFDKQLNKTEECYKWLSSNKAVVLHVCNQDKTIVFVRAGCLFLFNFHEENSYFDYKIGIPSPGKYHCVLNTDNSDFGGFKRLDESVDHFSQPEKWQNQSQYLSVYLPSKTAQIYVSQD